MHSLLSERRISLNEAARLSEVNPSTTWRWALKGVRGVILETFALGAKRYTTVEALGRFSERCTAAAAGGKSGPVAMTPSRLERETERALAELAKLGV